MTSWQILGLILGTLSIGILLGAAIGYYTGYADALKNTQPRYRRTDES